MKDTFGNITPENRHDEVDFGPPVGKEFGATEATFDDSPERSLYRQGEADRFNAAVAWVDRVHPNAAGGNRKRLIEAYIAGRKHE